MEIRWQDLAEAFSELGYALEGEEPANGILTFVLDHSRFDHHVMPDGTVDVEFLFEDLDTAKAITSLRVSEEELERLKHGIFWALQSRRN